MGKIKNWKELGGPDRPVVVISRDTSSGTYEVWAKKVMTKKRVYPGALLQASNGAVSQAVAKNKNAIGYIGIGYMSKDVKPLMVNRIVGSAATTLNGTYPISRPPLHVHTRMAPRGMCSISSILSLIQIKARNMWRKPGMCPFID